MRVLENLNINLENHIRLLFYHFLIRKQFKKYITTKGEERDLYVYVIDKNDIKNEIESENKILYDWVISALHIINEKYSLTFNYFCSLVFFPFMSMDPHIDISDKRKYIFTWPILPLIDENFSPVFIHKKSTDLLSKEDLKNINDKSYNYEKLSYHKKGIMFNIKYYHYITNNENFRMSIQLVFSD